MAAYGHICTYIQHLGAREVRETYSQFIHTQEAGVRYTKLTQLQYIRTQLPCKGL